VLARRLLTLLSTQPCQKIDKHLPSSTNQLSTFPTHHYIITMEYENEQRTYDGLSPACVMLSQILTGV
jgi:hypothetical protein